MRTTSRHILLAVILIIVALAIALVAWSAIVRVSADMAEQSAGTIKAEVVDAAVQCFAIEGSYPSSRAHLEDDYGLKINHDDYIVTYNCFASNVMPQVEVLARDK